MKDVRIDEYRNATPGALTTMRLSHLPTGIVIKGTVIKPEDRDRLIAQLAHRVEQLS